MKKIYLLVLVLSISISSFSQDRSSCVTSEVHESRMQNDLNYKQTFEQIQQGKSIEPDTGQIFTIPIVFHVIHLGEAEGSGSNISDAQILRSVERINNDFEFANDLGLDIGIRFCLAKVDPNGQPTSGITRYDGSGIVNYTNLGISYGLSSGLNELTIKSTTGWPNTRYYNIWVVHNIVGGWGGYAYYPSTNLLDGTVILDYLVDDYYDVLTHELGHGFDLRHTFEGDFDDAICPANNNCANQGDLICDTPPHKKSDCSSTNPCASNGNWDYSRFNLMSYCPNGTLITPDQKTRLRNAANKYPRILLNSSSKYVCADEITFDIELTSINTPLQDVVIQQCGNGITGSFTVTNIGNVPIQQFSVDYTYDGVVNSNSYNTNMIPGASKDFTLPQYLLPISTISETHQLTIEVLNVNESIDDNLDNNLLDIEFDINDTCTIVGIENAYLSKIKVFPTLNIDRTLKIKNLPIGVKTAIRVIDASGRVLINTKTSQNNLDLDMSNLSNGVYFVSIEINGYTSCKKLVLQ